MAIGDTLVTYNGDGVTTNFAIPFTYTLAAEVVVTRKDGAVTYTFPSSNIIQLTSPAVLAVGDVLTIQRVTAIESPAATFRNGAPFIGTQLNSIFTQLLRGLQEVRDKTVLGFYVNLSNVFDALNKRITNVATPTASTDAATKGYVDGVANVSGNVVAPGAGNIGKFIKALTATTWDWISITAADISDATAFGRSLLQTASATTARTLLGLTSSAITAMGTAANQIVQLDASARLPAVDGRNLVNTIGAGENFFINPTFAINQFTNPTTVGSLYCADGWIATATGASVNVSAPNPGSGLFPGQLGGNSLLFPGSALLTNQGVQQRIEASRVNEGLRGWIVVSCYIYNNQASNTLTSLTLQLFTPTAVDNFTVSNMRYNVGQAINLAAGASTRVQWTLDTSAFVDGEKGLLVSFVTSAVAQAGGLAWSGMKIERGTNVNSVATPFNGNRLDQDYSDCMRFYQKSFPLATAPAQNAGLTGAESIIQNVGASSATVIWQGAALKFKVPMRASPTMTYYNPQALNAQIRNTTGSTDWSSTANFDVTKDGFSVTGTTPAGSASGNTSRFHWTADARI